MTRQQVELIDAPEITPDNHQARVMRETLPALAEMDSLRLLLVTPRYFPFMGGVENHVYQVARRLARAKIDVTVLSTDPGGQLPTKEQSEGVKIRRVRAWPAKRDYYFAPDIYQVITRGNWDVVHIQSYHTLVAPLGMLAALRANVPYVVTFHGGGHTSPWRNAIRGVQRALLRPLLARADRLVSIARFEIELFGERLGIPADRFVHIPNGADLPQVSRPARTAADGTLIVSMGRLERYKGHQRVIAALPHILKEQPDARLWIAGTGPHEAALRRLAAKLGVAERVNIRAIPAANREMMAVELSKASLFILLSEYETHPIAVLEALSLGCPALVADNSGLRELAEQGLAQAVPLESKPEEVAVAALKQLREPLVPTHIELPTWDDCAGALLTLYRATAREATCAS